MLFIGLVFLLTACHKTEVVTPQPYEGPIREGENVDMIYTQKEKISVKIKAKRVSEFANGDQQFPEGVYIEFYDEAGAISSILSANTAFYYKADNKWLGQGKVEVKNILKDEQLNTEELLWFPAKRKITTDKFVTIRSNSEVLYGTGLDAAQDMSKYEILHPEGDFAIDEQENQ